MFNRIYLVKYMQYFYNLANMEKTIKINKEVYANLIIALQKQYKLNNNVFKVSLLLDENMLAIQLASLIDLIEGKSPNLSSNDGIGDFGVRVDNIKSADIENKNQLVLSALNKLNKENLVEFSFNTIQQNSNKLESQRRYQRSRSMQLTRLN